MEWSKIKNIMLFMLVITNLLLLFFVVVPSAQQKKLEDEGIQSAIALLAQRGITVDAQVIPDEIDIHAQTVTPDRSLETTLAENLLGDDAVIQDLGGDVYHYSNGSSVIRFHSGGEFTAQFESSLFPLGETSSETHGQTIVSLLQLDASLTAVSRTDDSLSLIYNQLWDGVPLLDYGFTLHYEENSLIQISSAKRLAGDAVVIDTTDLPVSTALMQFLTGIHQLGDICRTITSISSAYSSTTSLSGTVQLNPLWCIETDTGAYQLDLVTGTLTRS